MKKIPKFCYVKECREKTTHIFIRWKSGVLEKAYCKKHAFEQLEYNTFPKHTIMEIGD